MQFHPEVDASILRGWLGDLDLAVRERRPRDAEVLAAGVAAHMDGWNAFGRELSAPLRGAPGLIRPHRREHGASSLS